MHMQQFYDQLANNINKLFVWFKFKPNDERERQLFHTAYYRAYVTLLIGLLLFGAFISANLLDGQPTLFKDILNQPEGYFEMIGIILAASYLAGGSAFWGHDVVLTKLNRIYWLCIILFGLIVLLQGGILIYGIL